MSSSDEEVASPQLGASSSKDHQPVAPMLSESDDDDFVIKKLRNNKRPRDASCSKDRQPVTPDASESNDGDDSAKKKTRKYKRPRILWDRVVSIEKGVEAEMDDDERKAVIIHLGFGRFGCKCQVKITENSNFHLLET